MKRKWQGYLLLFVVTSVVTLIVRMPLALVLKAAEAQLIAERVEGTIWNGRITNAWVRGYPLGNVDVSLDAVPLFVGKVAAKISVRGSAVDGTGRVSVRGRTVTLKDGQFRVTLAALDVKDVFGAPMTGSVDVDVPMLQLDDGRCVDGGATVATDALQKSAARFDAAGFPLSGEGRCDNGAFVLPLSGEGPEGQAELGFRIAREGYMSDLFVIPTQPQFADVLEAFGFQEDGAGFRLVYRGDL